MIRLPSALALGLAVALAPVAVRAETAPPTTPPKLTPTAEQRMVAREHYEKAVGHFNNNEYIAAAEEFLAVHQAVPQPALLYNAAQAYRLGGDVHKALEYYRAFLVEAPEAKQRADVERHIKELEGKATVAVKNAPPDMAAPPAATATTAKPTEKPGSSDRLQAITGVIKQNRAAFRACFDKWSRQHPGVNGRVTLTFYLDPDGNLDEPNADEKGFAAPEVAACIEDVSQKLRYPQSPSGKFTRFSYPFDFKAAR